MRQSKMRETEKMEKTAKAARTSTQLEQPGWSEMLPTAHASSHMRDLLVRRAVVKFGIQSLVRMDTTLAEFTQTHAEDVAKALLGPATDAGFPTADWTSKRVRAHLAAYFERPLAPDECLALLTACGFGFESPEKPSSPLILLATPERETPPPEQHAAQQQGIQGTQGAQGAQPRAHRHHQTSAFAEAATTMLQTMATQLIPTSTPAKDAVESAMVLAGLFAEQLVLAAKLPQSPNPTLLSQDLAAVFKRAMDVAVGKAQSGAASSRSPASPESSMSQATPRRHASGAASAAWLD